MITTRDEYIATVERFEQAVTELALIAMAFRRLEKDLWPGPRPTKGLEPVKGSDFNYMTGTIPEDPNGKI